MSNPLCVCPGDVVYQSPLTPAELLIALHQLDDKVDMKTTIKGTHTVSCPVFGWMLCKEREKTHVVYITHFLSVNLNFCYKIDSSLPLNKLFV